MRTQQEILERFNEVSPYDDFFGAYRQRLIESMDLETAKPFLKDEFLGQVEAGKETWEPVDTDEKIDDAIRDYLPFAWEKANNCRGLSASRSLDHIRGLLWLKNDSEAPDIGEDHTHYGKPQLRAVSEYIGFDWKAEDDGIWTNNEYDGGVSPDEVPPPQPTTTGD